MQEIHPKYFQQDKMSVMFWFQGATLCRSLGEQQGKYSPICHGQVSTAGGCVHPTLSIISRAISKVPKLLESKNIEVSSLSASYASGREIDPGLGHTYNRV